MPQSRSCCAPKWDVWDACTGDFRNHDTDSDKASARVENSGRWVRGFVGGTAVIDSKHVKVVYGARRLATYFFPTADVRMDLLQPSKEENGEQK